MLDIDSPKNTTNIFFQVDESHHFSSNDTKEADIEFNHRFSSKENEYVVRVSHQFLHNGFFGNRVLGYENVVDLICLSILAIIKFPSNKLIVSDDSYYPILEC